MRGYEPPGGQRGGAASSGGDGPSWWDQGGDGAACCSPEQGESSLVSPHHLGDNVGTELAPGHAEEGANMETAGEVAERAQAIHLRCASIPNAPESPPGYSGKH